MKRQKEHLHFRYIRGNGKCCCGHAVRSHGGDPCNFHWRMRCLKCRCIKLRRCAPWHRHLIGKVRHAIMKGSIDAVVRRIRKLACKS